MYSSFCVGPHPKAGYGVDQPDAWDKLLLILVSPLLSVSQQGMESISHVLSLAGAMSGWSMAHAAICPRRAITSELHWRFLKVALTLAMFFRKEESHLRPVTHTLWVMWLVAVATTCRCHLYCVIDSLFMRCCYNVDRCSSLKMYSVNSLERGWLLSCNVITPRYMAIRKLFILSHTSIH